MLRVRVHWTVAVTLIGAALGCHRPVPSADAGSGVDSSDSISIDTGSEAGVDTPPDLAGDMRADAPVCCPIETPSCDCFSTGGTRPAGGTCDSTRICDAGPMNWHMTTDANGCPKLVQSPAGGGCLPPPPPPGTSDAGSPDASDGAATDTRDGAAPTLGSPCHAGDLCGGPPLGCAYSLSASGSCQHCGNDGEVCCNSTGLANGDCNPGFSCQHAVDTARHCAVDRG